MGPPPGPSCEDQVEALLSTNSSGYVALGYGSTAMLAAVDNVVGNFLATNASWGAPWPGGVISVTRDGQMLLARSYGYGDGPSGMYMEPDSRLRLASVSKSLTAMAILTMVHDGVIADIDTEKPFNYLKVGVPKAAGKDTSALPFETLDHSGYGLSSGTDTCASCSQTAFGYGGKNPRLNDITVDQLLHHGGGWDRGLVVDPVDKVWPGGVVDVALGSEVSPGPATSKQIIQYQQNQPLQFAPDTQQAYSNFGYITLSETIAELGKTTYEDYVTTHVLAPLGMTETTLGATQLSGRQDREVTYVDYTCINAFDDAAGACESSTGMDWTQTSAPYTPFFMPTPPWTSVFPSDTTPVPGPYGSDLYLEGYQGSGGWVSSAIDLARFTGAIESHNLPMFTKAGWPDEYYALSDMNTSPGGTATNDWYGNGWDNIHTQRKDAAWSSKGEFGGASTDPHIYDWEKDGGMSGTSSEILIEYEGYTLTGVFNSSYPGQYIDPLLWQIKSAVAANLPATSYDILPAYDGGYTSWQEEAAFRLTLASAATSGQYPVRVDGMLFGPVYPKCTIAEIKADECPPPYYVPKFRARLGSAPSATTVLFDQTCAQINAALGPGAGHVDGQVVSFQKFLNTDGTTYSYQAVFAPPPD